MSDTCPVCGGPLKPTDSACPTCGFKLLGSTQGFKPIVYGGTEQFEIIPDEAKPVKLDAALRIVRGPQIETLFQLEDKPFTIGRSPQCDIFLNDMTVSREHAIIEPSGSTYRITDQNSFNGIWINNENVMTAELNDGDIIQIGAFCLLYEL